MTTAITSQSSSAGIALSADAVAYALQASAPNTRRAYRAAWADFATWCREAGQQPLPAAPETVGSYLAARAVQHRPSTLALRLAAITQAHRLAGQRLDTGHAAIRETLKGIRRTHGTAPQKKAAAEVSVLQDMIRELAREDGPRAVRNRALLLIGFAAALRRSELVALDVDDVTFVQEGAVLTLRRRKTDQAGVGTLIAIPHGTGRTCPVEALRTWLDTAGITEGPIFRSINRHGQISDKRLSDRAVANVVQEAARVAGHDPGLFGGHSLRSGFATSAARAGVPEAQIQNQTGHRSLPVLRSYIRRGNLFVDNAAGKVGL